MLPSIKVLFHWRRTKTNQKVVVIKRTDGETSKEKREKWTKGRTNPGDNSYKTDKGIVTVLTVAACNRAVGVFTINPLSFALF